MVPLSLSMLVLCSKEFLPNTHFYIFFDLCMVENSNIAVIFDYLKKGIEKITLMLKNLYESACLTAIYLIFLQNSKKNDYFVNRFMKVKRSNPPCAMTVAYTDTDTGSG